MSLRQSSILAACFAIAFLAIGLTYWPIPYAQADLPGDLSNIALLIVATLAAVARVAGRSGLLASCAAVGASVPAAILARVVVETAADPTSHNLWPFEVVIAGGAGFACALAGALVGGFVARRRTAAAGD